MKILILSMLTTLTSSAFAFETITHLMNEKSGQTTVHLSRDTVKSIKGVPCTAQVEVANMASVAQLTNIPATTEIGMMRYCGEIKTINIEKTLQEFAAVNDVMPATTKSQVFEVIYVSPENPVGKQCERQIVEYLEVTLANGGKLKLQNGFDIPGAPSAETCRGLR